MKVKYTDAAAPAKRGLTEHLKPATAAALIAAGFAEPCPLPRRNDPEWLAARMEQASLAGPPDRADVLPGFVVGVEWGVRDRVHKNGQVLIIKKTGCDVFYFDEKSIPKDCPKSIVDKFNAYSEGDGAAYEALLEAQREQEAYKVSLIGKNRW